MRPTLTNGDFSLVRLALCEFSAHHAADAKLMDGWAAEEDRAEELRAKCRRNAEASRDFVRRADELLAKFRA